MDRRAGPLPAFIYGTYYQYNSHNRPFPTQDSVKDAKQRWERDGPPVDLQGPRATSTISYDGPHGVQSYNDRQRKLWASLQVPEKLKAALEQVR